MQAPRTALTLDTFKTLAREIRPFVHTLLKVRIFAEMERERVTAYVTPIFERYTFPIDPKFVRGGETVVTKQADLYLAVLDSPDITAYYADCDAAHRAHGFTGPDGHCPALVAENLVMQTERALIDLAADATGITSSDVFGEERKKYLDILIGAALKDS